MDPSNCKKLVELIENNKDIENFLSIYHARKTTRARYTWEFKLAYLKSIINDMLKEEEIWTFIISCAYAYDGIEGIHKLTSFLCQIPISEIPTSSEKIFIEYKPMTPRKGIQGDSVRSSEIDIALGCIDLAKKRKIYYRPIDSKNNWICFAEMKLLDDIQVTSGNNPIRNQLIRIIEDAVTFQRHGEYKFPKKVHVTLVTPALFNREQESRLYGFKFNKYKNNNKNNTEAILCDINKARMGPRNERDWRYPINIVERLEKNLFLHWVTLEDMIANIPANLLKEPIEELYNNIKDLIENRQVKYKGEESRRRIETRVNPSLIGH